ncbi:alpha/beta fold hydrolase [Paracoccus marinaquae]|uniref:Alpha/beta hydrolase n=1 Tax=Paracoccus marinaquae TaxID=2841926 RepID=A0ABS6ALK2_9RHOB|nr:alpha/beta hydrolase [Paracoccus marinaquae]MBU3030306.1 alpha/beta hydrolase [Paracoccus marinaquae]
MATFVLVHNGFAGAWVWRQVEHLLRDAGHEVHTPTLTGLGARAHLAHPGIDLGTHVADVLGTFACEEISGAILVGSSSSGTVIAGVAERLPRAIRQLVFLDTPVPTDGQSWFDIIGPEVAAPLLDAARLHGDGWRVPRNDVPPPRWVPHPLGAVTERLRLTDPDAARLPRTMIHCTDRPPDWFLGLGGVIDRAAEAARGSGIEVLCLKADHLPQLSCPGDLAGMLNAIAGSSDEDQLKKAPAENRGPAF